MATEASSPAAVALPAPSPATNTTPAIVPASDELNDGDPSFGDGDATSDLNFQSITSSIYNYRKENGRTYHAYSDGKYLIPNDEQEQNRLDMMYHSLLLLLKGKAFFAPMPNPQRILDIGTGIGIWALDVGDQYLEAYIIGIDLSPIQPQWVAPNVEFRVDDLENEWVYESPFDLIHARLCTGNAIKNHPKYLADSYHHLKPGGWCEGQELYFDVFTVGFDSLHKVIPNPVPPKTLSENELTGHCDIQDDNSLPANSHVKKWHDLMVEGADMAGSPCRISSFGMKAMYEEAGFVNVTILDLKWPIAPWPAEKRLKEAGAFVMFSMLDGLMGVSQAIFTRLLGWSMQELEVLLVGVRKEWKTTGIHAYWPCYVIYGQKPQEN